MPTYQYRCLDCGDEFEEYQSILDPPLKTCKKCNGKLQRLISGGAGFLFKGSGFYITDHRSSSYKKDAAKDKTDSATSKSKSTDSKKTSSNKNK